MAPVYLLRPSCAPWTGGAISLAAVVERLKDLLPPTFEDLNTVRPHTPHLALTRQLRMTATALLPWAPASFTSSRYTHRSMVPELDTMLYGSRTAA